MKKDMIACLGIFALAALVPMFAGSAAGKNAGHDTGQCQSLIGLEVPADHIGKARVLSAETANLDGRALHCHVKAVVEPDIHVEILLPESTWNGRYLQIGCGGFCGRASFQDYHDALQDGFALAANDMGHAGESWEEPRWGLSSELRRDFGARSAHVTAIAAKIIIASYYRQQAGFSYLAGCSTGGREGLGAAASYPSDFDGIVAGAPAFPARMGGIANNWDARHLLKEDGDPVFANADLTFLHRQVIAQCDGIDGVNDGILADPRSCRFDPARLSCGLKRGGQCLTAEQVSSARALYAGPRNSAGVRLFPGGSTFGSELGWDGLRKSAVASSYLRFLGFPQPALQFDPRTFDWDKDVSRLEPMAKVYDPVAPYTQPNLSQFKRRGGKLIAYQGWSDPGVLPEALLDYRARLEERENPGQLESWFRVYMFPGMGHCRGGSGPDRFDLLPKIVDWVEKGIAPDRVVASQLDNDGKLLRTRPVYPYPWTAKFVGQDPDRAEDWIRGPAAVHAKDKIDWLWARQSNEQATK